MRGTTPSDSAVGPIRAGHGFDGARLAEYLAARLPGFGAGLAVQQFRGGQSCPTYRLETAGKRYVLRRKPPGRLLPTAHAIEREFLVLRALAGSAVPVPEALLLCEDPAVIGTPFYVMAEVPGRIFWDLTLPDVAATERAALYDAMNATIAALHRLDPVALGLGDYGRPAGYVARQIERWTAQYRASETETIPAMERLIAWLPAHLPPDTAAALVHGDFRLDNLIFAADEPRVVAVLDWEVSTLGDPLADFAYHCMMWRLPPDAFQGLRGVDL
ncbi:MAG: phosphotransferase family protein, partial [Alphaproteobacteria bacterium]|nr:phosphotransferase family protein [Alphaproteobacteria bacterium]